MARGVGGSGWGGGEGNAGRKVPGAPLVSGRMRACGAGPLPAGQACAALPVAAPAPLSLTTSDPPAFSRDGDLLWPATEGPSGVTLLASV